MFSICITAAAGTDFARNIDNLFILYFILYMLGQVFTHCLIFSTAEGYTLRAFLYVTFLFYIIGRHFTSFT